MPRKIVRDLWKALTRITPLDLEIGRAQIAGLTQSQPQPLGRAAPVWAHVPACMRACVYANDRAHVPACVRGCVGAWVCARVRVCMGRHSGVLLSRCAGV